MPATFTYINKSILTGTQKTITFSAIPATYTDLCVYISARSNYAAQQDWFICELNAQTTNYSNRYILGTGTTVIGNTTTYRFPGVNIIPAANSTATTFSNVEIYLPEYTSSLNKIASIFGAGENNSTTSQNANIMALAGLSSNTAITSSISITCDNGSFVSDSSFYLYGIKNS